jgi:quercetin dioxygenase-like cupin family protein
MAIDLFKGFSNPVTGERFRCLSFSRDAFVCEFIVLPKGGVPFEHIHLNQDEIFHVVSGEILLVIDGVEKIGKTGDTIVVPKGKSHIAYNNSSDTLRCIVEYRPGLDNYMFFQCFAGLTIAGDYDKKGQINIPKMLYFTKLMRAQCISRPTSIPAPVFRLALEVCYVVGGLRGWKRFFEEYTS